MGNVGAVAPRGNDYGEGRPGARQRMVRERVRGGGVRGRRRDRSGRQPDGVGEEESAQQVTPVCGLVYIVGMICRGGSRYSCPYKYISRGGS